MYFSLSGRLSLYSLNKIHCLHLCTTQWWSLSKALLTWSRLPPAWLRILYPTLLLWLRLHKTVQLRLGLHLHLKNCTHFIVMVTCYFIIQSEFVIKECNFIDCATMMLTTLTWCSTSVSSMQIKICAIVKMKTSPYFIFVFPFWLWQVSCWSSAAHQARDRADGMWGSHGPHNHVYGPSGDGLRSSAGPDPDH